MTMGERIEKEGQCKAVDPERPMTSAFESAVCTVDDTLKRRAKPVVSPVPFVVDKDRLDFAGVVGRSSIGLTVAATNRERFKLIVDARIEGDAAFEIEPKTKTNFVDPQDDGGATEVVVRYVPKSAGEHRAVLVVSSDPGGEQRVQLHGSASVLPAEKERGQVDENLEGVPTLPDVKKAVPSADHRRDLPAAMDALSRLGPRFNSLAPMNDAANAKAKARMIKAVSQLNKSVMHWLTGEGVQQMKSSHGVHSGADGVIEAFLMKGIEFGLEEFLEMGGPLLASVMFAIELGSAINDGSNERAEDREADAKYQEVMGSALDLGVQAQDTATSAVMHRYGQTIAAYAATRAEIHDLAGPEAMGLIADLQNIGPGANAGSEYFYEKAQAVLDRFHHAMTAWGAATGQMEHAAVLAEGATTNGMSQLLDRYLAFRMEYEREQMPKQFGGIAIPETPELRKNFETVVVDGGISFAEPANIQFNDFRFGEYSNMSPAMREFGGSKVVGAFEGNLEIRLFAAEGGTVTFRLAGTDRKVDATEEARAYVKEIGDARLWAAIEDKTISPKVIKVAR
jgi:hypothetical protein